MQNQEENVEAVKFFEHKIYPPETFDPTKHDPYQWLVHFESKAGIAKWNDVRKVEFFPNYLDTKAAFWFSEFFLKGDDKTWKDLKTSFLENFSKRQEFPIKDLLLRVLRPKETIQSYFIDKVAMCLMVDPQMEDSTKVKHVLHGIPVTWQSLLTLGPEIKLNELQAKLITLDSLHPRNGGSTPDMVCAASDAVSSLSLTELRSVIREEVQRSMSDLQAQGNSDSPNLNLVQNDVYPARGNINRNPNGGIYRPAVTTCYRCNRQGHIARNCYTQLGQGFNAQSRYPVRFNHYASTPRYPYPGQFVRSTNAYRGITGSYAPRQNYRGIAPQFGPSQNYVPRYDYDSNQPADYGTRGAYVPGQYYPGQGN